jgi:UDP-N-acetylglucosamine 2-epimerase (non-hydrolysing)
MKILHVVGARPNFVKLAPVFEALGNCNGIHQTVAHTGQHYDFQMSEIFFKELGLLPPDVNLGVGSKSNAHQIAEIMTGIEEILLANRPDWVLVYGDVNSTLAAALVCAKLLIPIGHVEAGLRSFDRTMAEEINRLLTDRIASLLFTPSEDANRNLLREGVAEESIHFVGNVMIDSLRRLLPIARRPESLQLKEPFVLVTLHRPSNVDDPEVLTQLLEAVRGISKCAPIVFPVHPRTRRRMADLDVSFNGQVQVCSPLPYLEFLWLERHAAAVVTDSGGVQEETTYLGVPCLTVRENTERPITVERGTNQLIGKDFVRLESEVKCIVLGRSRAYSIPPLWDGLAGERIAKVITGINATPSCVSECATRSEDTGAPLQKLISKGA